MCPLPTVLENFTLIPILRRIKTEEIVGKNFAGIFIEFSSIAANPEKDIKLTKGIFLQSNVQFTYNFAIIIISNISQEINEVEVLHENTTGVFGVDHIQNLFLGYSVDDAVCVRWIWTLSINIEVIK